MINKKFDGEKLKVLTNMGINSNVNLHQINFNSKINIGIANI